MGKSWPILNIFYKTIHVSVVKEINTLPKKNIRINTLYQILNMHYILMDSFSQNKVMFGNTLNFLIQ
jgi:hypothetical protein